MKDLDNQQLLRKYADAMQDYGGAPAGSKVEKEADELSSKLESEILIRLSAPEAQKPEDMPPAMRSFFAEHNEFTLRARDYQGCKVCGTLWLANEKLPCPVCALAAQKPPAAEPDLKMLEAIAADGLLVTYDKDKKFTFSRVVKLMAEFAANQLEQQRDDEVLNLTRTNEELLRMLKEEKLAASTAPGWIALFAERPETGKWCWVIIGKTVQHVPAKLNDDEDDNPVWEWMNEGDEAPFNVVTHWQPLAAPPAPHKET